jgi:hypothetical protein
MFLDAHMSQSITSFAILSTSASHWLEKILLKYHVSIVICNFTSIAAYWTPFSRGLLKGFAERASISVERVNAESDRL